jgi:hypothetical protein
VPGYEVLALLGAGGSGQVWRARGDGTRLQAPSHDVALKVVPGGEEAERELAVLRELRHEHVVSLLDSVALPEGRIALALRLVEGGTLAQLVAARGHLRAGEVVTVVAPLASTVAQLHAKGIQHGDLAPGNVLFDDEGRPLLGDLGTVRITGAAREEQFGTPGYVDPVVVAGGAGGPASDVYGLGALAWFALTGRTPPSALTRVPLGDVVPGLPAGLVEAVDEALDPDPLRRPDPASLARRIYDAAAPEPVWLVGLAPADGGLTHRIRRLAAADADPIQPPARHRARRERRARGERTRIGRTRSGRTRIGRTRSGRTRIGRTRSGRAFLGPAAVLGAAGLAAAALAVATVAVVRSDRLPPDPAGDPAATRAPMVTTVDKQGPTRAADAPTVVARAAPAVGARSTDEAGAADAGMTDRRVLTVLRDLTRLRARAFAQADPSVLDRVTEPGSPADRAARSAVTELVRRGLRYQGLDLRVRTARVTERAPGRVVVEVVTDATPYVVVGHGGAVRRREPARSGTTSTLVLVSTAAGWRVGEVRG